MDCLNLILLYQEILNSIKQWQNKFYATKKATFDNQTGYDTTIKIGGINENAAQDNISPKVKLYMNDETFVSGGITNSSPFISVTRG
jgi:hypothetical protein